MKEKLTNRLIKSLEPQTKLYKVWDIEIPGFFIKVRPSGTMNYGIYYRVNGKASEYTLGKHPMLTVTQARHIAMQKAAEIIAGTDIQAEKQASRQRASAEKLNTLGGFINTKYNPWITAETKSGRQTIQRLEHHFADWYNKPLTDINKWLVTNWRSEQLKRGNSPNGVNRITGLLTAVLNKAVEWEIIETSPLFRFKPLKVDSSPKVRYLNDEEESSLRHAIELRQEKMRQQRLKANKWREARGYKQFPERPEVFTDHLKALILLALNTGMRRGELFNLKWSDIDFQTRTLTVNGSTAKSGNTRHIPLNHEGFSVISKWREQSGDNDLVFPSPQSGRRLDNINSAWTSVIKLSGIKKFRFHDLRHHFASQLVMKGVDLNTVRELLGHSELNVTLRYAHLAPEHKAAAVAVLDK